MSRKARSNMIYETKVLYNRWKHQISLSVYRQYTDWLTNFLYFDLHAYQQCGRHCWYANVRCAHNVYCDSNTENVPKHLLFQVSSRITIITSLLRSILKSQSRCKLFRAVNAKYSYAIQIPNCPPCTVTHFLHGLRTENFSQVLCEICKAQKDYTRTSS